MIFSVQARRRARQLVISDGKQVVFRQKVLSGVPFDAFSRKIEIVTVWRAFDAVFPEIR